MTGRSRTSIAVRCPICERRIYYHPGKGQPAKTLAAHRAKAHRDKR
jgi:hypothetical protein